MFLVSSPVEWRVSKTLVEYEGAVCEMEDRVAAIRQGKAGELIWLLQHPSCYTAGVSAREEELLDNGRFPVYRTGRGGQFTYHGPGQRVIYVMWDLQKRQLDVRSFVRFLEEWLIKTLWEFGILGECREGRPGIWVKYQGRDAKIAALGVRIRHWISYHGMSVNIAPQLEHFSGIVPCGLKESVTSFAQLGKKVSMGEFDAALERHASHV